jgi:cell wall assembly regulator SMI1
MGTQLHDLVGRWVAAVAIDPRQAPEEATLAAAFGAGPYPCRAGADPRAVESWERRYGFALPRGLRAWLLLSDGFFHNGVPWIHPLAAIGPMVPFARVPDLVVQPESWFELGNPNVETVCIDLAYQWPGGDCPIFTSGDDQAQSPPKVIATSFESWFLNLLHQEGREYWFGPDATDLGDPWSAHRRNTPTPPLPDRLRALAPHVLAHMRPGADDRAIASTLGISRGDVETILRHLQHGVPDFAGP